MQNAPAQGQPGRKNITAIRRCSLPRATKPRPPPHGATNSHNHVEVVAVFKWRLNNHHAACNAHGVRIGPTSTTNFCQHRRGADCTLFETPPAILILRVSNHANKMTEMIVQRNTYLCGAIIALANTVQATKGAKEFVPCEYRMSALIAG